MGTKSSQLKKRAIVAELEKICGKNVKNQGRANEGLEVVLTARTRAEV